VLGLSSLGRTAVAPPKRAAAPGGLNIPTTYGPTTLAALYDAPAAATGGGQSVAVIAEGDLSGPRQDLVTSRTSTACRT
jgi:hypothetical protein